VHEWSQVQILLCLTLSFSVPLHHLFSTIPSELGELSLLNNLSLDTNLLMGEVPSALGRLDLGYFCLCNNSITGSLDTFICNKTYSSNLEADCGGPFSEVVCSCCTNCCDDISGQCIVDVNQTCENDITKFEKEGEKFGMLCECLDEG